MRLYLLQIVIFSVFMYAYVKVHVLNRRVGGSSRVYVSWNMAWPTFDMSLLRVTLFSSVFLYWKVKKSRKKTNNVFEATDFLHFTM